MSGKTLAEKTYLRSGYRAAVLDAPDGFDGLDERPEDVRVDRALDDPPYDWILFFVTHDDPLARKLPQARDALVGSGRLWVAYPKGGDRAKLPTDLKRGVVWERGKASGMRAVAQVSVDETWSALRFERKEQEGV